MGGNVTGASQTHNYVTESYRSLGKLDFNGDNKVSGTEVQFLDRLGKLGPNPTADQITNLFDKVPKNELPQAFNIFMADRLSKMGDHPTEDQLKTFINSMPNNDFKGAAGQFITGKIFNDGSVNFDPSTNQISVMTNPDTGLPIELNLKSAELSKGISDATSTAADILDGDNKIKGIDQSVADDFLGGNTFQAATFNASTFNFNMLETKSVTGDNGQTATLTIDKRRERTTASELQSQRGIVDSFTNGKQTFAEFAASKGFTQATFDPGKNMDALKEFATSLPKDQRASFVSRFMEANFVHVGKNIDQTNVTQSNYTDLLSKLPKDESGKTFADCTFYAAMAQSILQPSSGKPQNIRVDLGGVVHDVSIIKTDGKYKLQSNGEFFDIPKGLVKDNMSLADLKKVVAATYKASPEFQKQFPDLNDNAISMVGKASGNDIFSAVKLEKGGKMGPFTLDKVKGDTFVSNVDTGRGSTNFYGRVTDKAKGEYVAYASYAELPIGKIVVPPGKPALPPTAQAAIAVTEGSIDAQGNATGKAYIDDHGTYTTYDVKLSTDASGNVIVTLK
jgi:hypothetical protein